MLAVLYICVIAMCGVCVLVCMRVDCVATWVSTLVYMWVPSFVTLHWVSLRQALLLEPASPSAPYPHGAGVTGVCSHSWLYPWMLGI